MSDYSHRPHWLAYAAARSPLVPPAILWTTEHVEQYRARGWDVTGPYVLQSMRADADERHAE